MLKLTNYSFRQFIAPKVTPKYELQCNSKYNGCFEGSAIQFRSDLDKIKTNNCN